jgi:hypothetical protein
MGDFGDIFDMFPQDEKGQRKAQGAQSQPKSEETDLKSRVINKLVKNKALLIAVVFIGVLVVGAAAYFLIGYIKDNGAKGIIDTVQPFIK